MALRIDMERIQTDAQREACEITLPRLSLNNNWCPTHGEFTTVVGEDGFCPTCEAELAGEITRQMLPTPEPEAEPIGTRMLVYLLVAALCLIGILYLG